MRRRRTRSNKNPFSVLQEPDLWNEYNEELINMKESLFIDKWHDTCEVLPDYDNVWFIADGKICVGIYEPEQKVFCMADGMGFELKNVRQWKYVGIDKQIAKFPNEKQIIAVSIPKIPCLATGIFTDHCIDEKTGDEVSAVILDWEMGIVPFKEVSYWFEIPQEPLVVLEPVGDAPLAVIPTPEKFVPNEVSENECPFCEGGITDEACPECEDTSDPEDTSPEHPMELGDRSMESGDVKSSIAKSKMAVSGSDDLNKDEDLIKKGLIHESVDKKRRFDKVQPWYKKTYPTDELGDEINPNLVFESIYHSLKKGDDIYSVLGVGDSLVRERVFGELADIYGVDYGDIFEMWLDNSEEDRDIVIDDSKPSDISVESTDKDKIGFKWIEDYKQGLFDLPELHRRILILFDGDYKAAVEWFSDAWDKSMRESKLKEAKIYYELTSGNYQPWSGAVDIWDKIVDAGLLDMLDSYLEDVYPDGLSETELNDILWFEGDSILESLGLSEEEDEEDIDDDETEEEEEQPIAEESYKGYDIYTWEDGSFTICKNDRYMAFADSVEDAKRIIDEGKID